MRKGKLPSLEAKEPVVDTPEIVDEIPAAVEDIADDTELDTESVSPVVVEPVGEKYTRIFLHEKSRAEDDDHVYAAVNGECLYLKRGTEVVLPQRFLEVLDHAVVPTYSNQADENGRARVGAVRRASFNILGISSREEFLRMKSEGKKSLQLSTIAASQRQTRTR